MAQPHQQQQAVGSGGKVTLLSSGSGVHQQEPAQQATSGSGGAGPRRKVGTTFERSFAQPAQHQQQTAGAAPSRPVLKPGKPVSSAPPAVQRPLTQLEREFANRPPQDQRWLLSFPLALKQLYFNFAESQNYDAMLSSLINRFPELLAGSDQKRSLIQVAIEAGNWGAAAKFVAACAAGQSPHVDLLRRRCLGIEHTYPMLALQQLAGAPSDVDFSAGLRVVQELLKACPDLAFASDTGGRNAVHVCVLLPTQRLPQALESLLEAAVANPGLVRSLGDALVARDAGGHLPTDLGGEAVAQFEGMLQRLRGGDRMDVDLNEGEGPPLLTPQQARDEICSLLAQQGKCEAFAQRLVAEFPKIDYRMSLLLSMEKPERLALDWLGNSRKAELKQVLAEIGSPELCHLIDRL